MKQTAVEWLIEQYKKDGYIGIQREEQAKEMEMQQQGYSEEDLEVSFFEGRENKLSFKEWFEQFKKK